MSNHAKLVQLRAKTDRDLLVLTIHALNYRLTIPDLGAAREVDTFYRKLIVLLFKTFNMSRVERARIERKVKEVRSDLIAAHALRDSAACSD